MHTFRHMKCCVDGGVFCFLILPAVSFVFLLRCHHLIYNSISASVRQHSLCSTSYVHHQVQCVHPHAHAESAIQQCDCSALRSATSSRCISLVPSYVNSDCISFCCTMQALQLNAPYLLSTIIRLLPSCVNPPRGSLLSWLHGY
jgi:hypothetical protein